MKMLHNFSPLVTIELSEYEYLCGLRDKAYDIKNTHYVQDDEAIRLLRSELDDINIKYLAVKQKLQEVQLREVVIVSAEKQGKPSKWALLKQLFD